MKKITLVAIIALAGATLFPSCKKDYKCTCTWSIGGQQQSNTVELKKMSKKDAKATCEGSTNQYSAYTGVSCALN
ncbi:hypothetical protein [Taibaiella koreensis]|uniref:hypothetical protein n=1 Tax=Taibaiella koreensis TaxID=1268548 RepID=UPI000E59A1F2|nr:hypothetical protein [Taibaiella koreensis]